MSRRRFDAMIILRHVLYVICAENPPGRYQLPKKLSQINPLWPSEVIWWQGSRSTLAQVMACCLTAPSHYLNQCWLMMSEVLWHSPDNNFTKKTLKIFIIELSLKFTNLILSLNPPGANELRKSSQGVYASWHPTHPAGTSQPDLLPGQLRSVRTGWCRIVGLRTVVNGALGDHHQS